jgi:hypothetical protein
MVDVKESLFSFLFVFLGELEIVLGMGWVMGIAINE